MPAVRQIDAGVSTGILAANAVASISSRLMRRLEPPPKSGKSPSHVAALTCHAERLLVHAESLTSHAERLLVHAESLTCHAERLLVHAESLTSHAERLLVHAESLTSHAKRLLCHPMGRTCLRARLLHLRESLTHLRAALLHLRAGLLHLRAAHLHLRAALLHLRAEHLHLRAALLHLRAEHLHLRAALLHLRAALTQGGKRARTWRIWVQTPRYHPEHPHQSQPIPPSLLCLLLFLSALCVSVLKSNLLVLPGGLHHYGSPAQNLPAPGRLAERLTVADAIRSVSPKLPWSRPLPRRKGFQRAQVNGCCDRLCRGCQRRVQQAVRIRRGPSCCASARSSTGGSGRRGVFSIARCAAAACFAGHRCRGHV